MADRIVYSTLCALAGSSQAQLQAIIDMASLWAAHLRDRARFDGRVVLLTNVPNLQIAGAESIAAPFQAVDRQRLFLERVLRFRAVPVVPTDQVMQMDLDALAVAPLDPLFEAMQPDALMAAPSRMGPLAEEQAGSLLTRCERWMYRARGWHRREGVSACVTGCYGSDWTRLMRRWAAAIRVRGRSRPVPQFGDQSFLNFLLLSGAARVQRLPPHLVYHVRQPGSVFHDPAAARAVVWHFPILPTPQRLEEMRRSSQGQPAPKP